MASIATIAISGVRKRKRSRASYQIDIDEDEQPDVHVRCSRLPALRVDLQRSAVSQLIPNNSPTLDCRQHKQHPNSKQNCICTCRLSSYNGAPALHRNRKPNWTRNNISFFHKKLKIKIFNFFKIKYFYYKFK